MRPLYLEMQGFGPYGNKVSIDFTQFANGGLYLVTGETGSGKTFIFDGICYALFGSVSGSERKTEMLRTIGLDNSVETYVKLEFVCKNKKYEITRKPAYEREKKRGTGTVTDNARVELTDGVNTWTRQEEVGAKIYEIIGLTVEQFKQIVMIAQGKFAQILQKSTKERRELLREIFNTNLYVNLEYAVKDEFNKLAGEYANRKREIGDKIHEITVSDESLAMELQELQQAEFVNVPRVLELTAAFDKFDEKLLKKYGGEEERLQKEKAELQVVLNKIKIKVAQEEKLAKLQKEKSKADNDASQAQKDAGKISEAFLFFRDNEVQKNTLEATRMELRNLYGLSQSNKKALEQVLNDGKDLQSATENALKEKAKYDEVYRQFLLAQAGIIAETLEDGKPCPVCGSIEHIQPAQLSADAPTEDEVKNAKTLSDKAEGNRQRTKGKLDSDTKVKEKAFEELMSAVNEFYGDDFLNVDLSVLDKKIREDGENTGKSIKELETAAINKRRELGMGQNEGVEQFEKRVQEIAAKAIEQAATINGAIKNLQEEMQKTTVDGNKDVVQSKIDANISALNAVKEQIDRVKERKFANAQAAKFIVVKQDQMADIESKRNEIDNLYRTLSGNLNLAGAAKLSFETYMQQAYFDRILAYANNRLLKISHARYKLVRKDDADAKGNAKVGLDLNVNDTHSGKERSANSLSGGETFMASLALALGMADEVQASAGGINIETMFIDEGFGSLSRDYLNTTVDVLDTLADNKHLVGIISHIEELKERIDQRVVVSKNDKGYSTISVEI
ncbi:MAG: SMC family ATPase [Phascolarctobacterium sp.]|nr:SMC family ATPase [Candidatus Phascolarctobacterium caballi]